MGYWVAGPIPVDAAREFAAWAGRMQATYNDLVKEGRTPEMGSLDQMNELIASFAKGVKDAADAAARAGQTTCTVKHERSPAEHRMLTDTGGAMQNYLEVLAIRGVIDMAPTAGVTEAIAGLLAGSYQD